MTSNRQTLDEGPAVGESRGTCLGGAATSAVSESIAEVPSTRLRVRLWFWVRRYFPAEVAATASVLVTGMAAYAWSGSVVLSAVVATIAENVAFYGIFVVIVYREQRRIRATRRQTLSRTAILLIAEFGPAELLDSLLVRPAAFVVALSLIPDAGWALFAGKVVADIVFYVAAAGGFSLSTWTGLRGSARSR